MYNDNELVLLEAMLYAMEGKRPSNAIENQERREQLSVVRNCRLPKRGNGGVPLEYIRDTVEFTKQQYERMGIKIIDEYDDLFYAVELPDGWEIKPTDHSMWNDVVDDKGRIRISFFYKGAFYDRDAFSNFNQRYDYATLPFDDYKTHVSNDERLIKPWSLCVTDCNERLKVIEERIITTAEEKWKMMDEFDSIGEKYMNEHYPDWEDINAYWD